ncbi:heterokaryon incompatibility protein-domain-containing protein [Triangularia setosa]|uniref:Heterokaryon incompatibility protein-domain-containing protein n=1 Tax=Triangularia setosa TaxID=2587417 RepID=A0AAN7A3E6_9PEZI|nr:heterokaryon incompatibility protein-domain-containing protein [Podospora setosa]
MKTATALGFENPHTCQHCSKIHLDLDVKHPALLCFWCDYNGVPKATGDGQYACENCERPFFISDNTEHHFSVKLAYDVPGIVDAAESGCELYRWVYRCFSVDNFYFPFLAEGESEKREEGLRGSVGKHRVELHGQNSRGGIDGLSLEVRLYDAATGKRFFVVPTHDVQQLDVCSVEHDPASEYTSCRPYVRDVTSDASTTFAKRCFQTCMETHTWCRTDQIIELAVSRKATAVLDPETVAYGDIPTRLLDLGTLSLPHLKLIETATLSGGKQLLLSQISRSGFMALSYCWGGDQNAKLTSSNLDLYKKSITLASLDQTLQDAIWVTRELGFRYLWIDALCILQDDLDGRGTNPDKVFEITRMASYYGRATLTLLAASASCAADGFLGQRCPDVSYRTGPIRLPLKFTNDTEQIIGNVYLVEELPEEKKAAEPITTRGWTLQESLLSRRILIFARRQLYYSCVNSFAGAGGSVTVLTDRMIPGRNSLVDGIYPVGSLIDQSTTAQWNVIVEEYTQRFLGQAGDKLWAVSALAEQIVRVGKQRGERKRYVAGLLVDEEDKKSWLAQLMWKPVGARKERPKRYRAPTWSWASVEAEVTFGRLHSEDPAVVEDWEVELAVEGAEYGALKRGAWIRLTGTVMTVAEVLGCSSVGVGVENRKGVSTLLPLGSLDDPVDRSEGGRVSDQAVWGLQILEDSWEDKEGIMAALADGDAGKMMLLVALEDWYSTGVAGILVERGAGDQLGLCQRRGSFFLERTTYAKSHSNVNSNFFQLGQRETLKII